MEEGIGMCHFSSALSTCLQQYEISL